MLEKLINETLQWAQDRNLIEGGNPKSQMLKCVSEVGELADNLNKQNDIKDDIGDVLVTLIIIAEMHNLTLAECLNVAYNDIKDRRGIMVDGLFIKESDPAYQCALNVIRARKAKTEL